MSIFFIIFLMIASVVILPIVLLAIQIISAAIALKSTRKTTTEAQVPRPTVAIIVPAHNEALGIANTIRSIQPQLSADDRLIIVADNCTDNTAQLAREHGVIVLERFNDVDRGKGFALDHGMQFLKEDPPQVVMIIDADCEISDSLIAQISTQCVVMQRPVQANYVMRFYEKGGIKQQVMEFAWIVKNTVRPTGYHYLGLPCQLMGTGMAFLWQDLSKCQLASGHLVEDMKLGLDLASIGKAPYYYAQASVKSYFPTSEQGIASQRLRWEHGHLGIIFKELPHYFRLAFQQKNLLLFAQVLDLMVPPLALLFMATLVLWGIALVVSIISGMSIYVAVLTAALCALGFGILIAWYCFARTIISFKTLLMAPLVLLMKLPVYFKFMVSRQVDWVRSKRDLD